ncbi:MAG: O-antigen ligase family protein [Bryobacteraceae bacterium]
MSVNWTSTFLLVWWISYLTSLFLWKQNDPNLGLIATKQGSVTNQVLISALGALGIWHSPIAVHRLCQKRSKWLFVLFAYTGWSALSILWSDNLALSVRRLGEFVILTAAGLFIGAGYYGRDSRSNLLLSKHMVVAALLTAVAIVAYSWNDLTLEHFLTPSWDPGVRAIGLYIAYPLSLAFIAMVAHFNVFTRKMRILLCVTFTVLMVFLKFRSLTGLTLACAFIVLFVKGRSIRKAVLVITSIGLLAGISYLTVRATGSIAIVNGALTWYDKGNDNKTVNDLNGRISLWIFLLRHRPSNWLGGTGFGAFWTSEQMAIVWNAVQWRAPIAHNGYLDEFLATGAIGLLVNLAFYLTATRSTFKLYSVEGDGASLTVLGWLILSLLFNTVDSINQFYFKLPYYALIAGLASVSVSRRNPSNNLRLRKPRFAVRRLQISHSLRGLATLATHN